MKKRLKSRIAVVLYLKGEEAEKLHSCCFIFLKGKGLKSNNNVLFFFLNNKTKTHTVPVSSFLFQMQTQKKPFSAELPPTVFQLSHWIEQCVHALLYSFEYALSRWVAFFLLVILFYLFCPFVFFFVWFQRKKKWRGGEIEGENFFVCCCAKIKKPAVAARHGNSAATL